MAGKPRVALSEDEKAKRLAEKNAKFKELVQKRLPKFQQACVNLSRLASYKPSDTQVEWLKNEMQKAAGSALAAFQSGAKTTAEIQVPD